MVKGSTLRWAFRSLGVIPDLFRCALMVEEGSMELSECEPPLSTSPPAFTCLKCSVLRFVELIFDFLYALLSDPIAAWRMILFFGFYFLQGQLSFLVWLFQLGVSGPFSFHGCGRDPRCTFRRFGATLLPSGAYAAFLHALVVSSR